MEPETREETLRRLRSIEGHIRGVQRMLEEERSCVEVIRQTLAIRKALDRVSQLLVSSHLRSCIAAGMGISADDPQGQAIQDLLDALELSGHL